MKNLKAAAFIGFLLMTSDGGRAMPRQDLPLDFSCSVFSANTSEAELVDRFGAENVTTALVPWGGAEGDYNEGTVLFPDSADARVEIFWADRKSKRRPEWVSVRGERSRWRSLRGITLGTDLLTIERLNRRPLRLSGFGHDGAGSVISWAGGRLEASGSESCDVRIRLLPQYEEKGDQHSSSRRGNLASQVSRDHSYSSGHPAMQALNPRVYELFLHYPPR